MSNLLPADFVILAFALVIAITGLFRGISGTIGFILGASAGIGTIVFGWDMTQAYFDSLLVRVVVIGLIALLLFGLVRLVFTKFVHCLVAQPGDAIFGFFSGLLLGAALFAAWAWLGLGLEYSFIASAIKAYF
ncbi:MAG: hypothetical protein J6S51_03875 [Kiritimatiellae bacterium]|nr:hypothetical protein [Kiritimatiellia bacterium]